MKRFEGALFVIALILHLLPVILFTPFVTLDGPAHLYNAGVLKSLLLDPGSVFHRLHEVNPSPEPNWTGHVFMALSMCVLPALFTEKLMLFTLLVGMAIGFRRVVVSIDRENTPWLSWLVFPFLYNFTLLLGFYNFSIALVLLLFWLSFWIRQRNSQPGLKGYAVIVFIFLLIYFSHLLVFLLAAGSASLLSFFMQDKKTSFSNRLREAIVPVVGAIPGFILSVLYLRTQGVQGFRGDINWLPAEKLWSDILDARMLIVYDFNAEAGYTKFFTVFLLIIAVVSLFQRNFYKHHFSVFLLFASATVLYFIIPDSLASGGIVSVRLLMWMFMTFCFWLIMLNPPRIIRVPVAILSLSMSVFMLGVHFKTQQSLSETARLYTLASSEIRERALVLPMNYSSNWLYSNMPGYLGVGRQVLVLDNYEADYGYFPVVWKKGFQPEEILGDYSSSSRPCIRIQAFEKQVGFRIDYVAALQWPEQSDDSCTTDARQQLHRIYQPALEGDLRLFERN